MNTATLEHQLGYLFKDGCLLETALRHSSYVNENLNMGLQDNERLEFLGDAILNGIVSRLLMDHYPHLPEGELSRLRSNLVNKTQLAKIARQLNLGTFLALGKGELQTLGRRKDSILADAFEALVAAIYLDSGFDRAFDIVGRLFIPLLAPDMPEKHFDYKTRLQEQVQAMRQTSPEYVVVGETGPDHQKIFEVEVTVAGIRTKGAGSSKKAAEQEAAERAMGMLDGPDNEENHH
jgi:ribonuclease III